MKKTQKQPDSEYSDRCTEGKEFVMATSSSSLPLGTAEGGSTASTSAADQGKVSDVPLLSSLQLVKRRRVKGEAPVRAGSRTPESADRRATIDALPDELMLEIFSHMSLSENINVLQRVCSRWKRLAQNAHLWRHKNDDVSVKEAIAVFAAAPELRTVILKKKVSPRVFKALSRSCPRLTTLELYQYQWLTLSEAENLFNGCKEIHTLSMSDRGIQSDPRFVDTLARLADLRVLRLWNHDYGMEGFPLRALADSCPQLCELGLGMHQGIFYQIRDAEYFISSHKSVLQCLTIRWTSVEGRNVAPLLPACAETLRSLALRDDVGDSPEETAEAFAALGRLHNLQQLRLSLDDVRVQHLLPALFGKLPKLQQLRLVTIVVDETTRAVAEHCPQLRELELLGCMGHTDALFEPLHQLKHLEILKIHHCECLRGKAMSYIAKLPALHTLEFSGINFNRLKRSVACILQLSGLRRLSFWDCHCSAIPFNKFPCRLANLRELEITYCFGDQEVLDRVCAEMPDLKVKGTLMG